MAAMESLSSWDPQANSQPPPPTAQAPKPIGVMRRSELASFLVCMAVAPSESQVGSRFPRGGSAPVRTLPLLRSVLAQEHDRAAIPHPLRHLRQLGQLAQQPRFV